MQLTLTEAQERGLKFACDKANSERLAALPETDREAFVPETPEEYAQRIFSAACDSYEAQRATDFERQKVEAFRNLSPEKQAEILKQFTQ